MGDADGAGDTRDSYGVVLVIVGLDRGYVIQLGLACALLLLLYSGPEVSTVFWLQNCGDVDCAG